jgi:hypothetical protein
VAKRPRFSRWRRLPGVFRTGDHRPPNQNEDPDRIILYVPPRILDLAEVLAEKAGVGSIQDYCALLLMQALENERIHRKVSDFEARRGPLEGWKEVAEDPDYLAEWKRQSEARVDQKVIYESDQPRDKPATPILTAPVSYDIAFPDTGDFADEIADVGDDETEVLESAGPSAQVDSASVEIPRVTVVPRVSTPSESTAMSVLFRHVALSGGDRNGFLPCLRRGEPAGAAEIAELMTALEQLEIENRGAKVLDRRMAHSLHRLALESQVLLTDAWSGVFDENVISSIRAVQEAVERILSGQDIRYYSASSESGQEQIP